MKRNSGFSHFFLLFATIFMTLCCVFCTPKNSDNNTTDADSPDGETDSDSAEDSGNDGDISGYTCEFNAVDAVVIRTIDTGHVAFPDITRLSDGQILLVYREASEHGVDPTGRITKQIGSADGTTWTDPEILHDVPDVDDRDPSVTTLSNGDIVLNYFQYIYQTTTGDGNLGVHQIFYGRSSDDGQTWGDFTMVPSGSGLAMDYPNAEIGSDLLWNDGNGNPVVVTACSNPIVEIGDRLFSQNYGGNAWNSANPSAPKSYISLFISDDSGATWSEQMIAPGVSQDTWLQEPSLLALDEENWIVHLRTASGSSPGNPGYLWQIRTDDGGQTWGDYLQFDFIGHAPYLYRLSNGVVLSAFRWLNDTYTSTNVNFIYSTDNGETWSEMISIIEPQTVEVGYPSILELADNRMLIVYYFGGQTIAGIIYEFQLVSP